MTLDQAKAAVQDMMLRESPNPIVVHERAGSVSPTDLPIQSYAVEELGKTLVKHAVDVIADYTTDLDVGSLTVLLAESKWSDLPEPLCPKMPLPDGIKLQMAVVQHPDAPGHYAVIKHFAFQEKVVDVRRRACARNFPQDRLDPPKDRHESVAIHVRPPRRSSRVQLVLGAVRCEAQGGRRDHYGFTRRRGGR